MYGNYGMDGILLSNVNLISNLTSIVEDQAKYHNSSETFGIAEFMAFYAVSINGVYLVGKEYNVQLCLNEQVFISHLYSWGCGMCCS